MVNIGRPRTGCSICAKRKLKCDETKPACLRCVKAGWDCPGYTASVDLIFRSRTLLEEGRPSHSTQGGVSEVGSPSGTWETQGLNSLPPPLDDRAISFFVHYFVLDSSNELASVAFAESLPGLLRTDKVGLLQAVMVASGMAAMGNAGNAKHWRIGAYQKYGQALRGLRESLTDPNLAVMDHTLAAILFLGMFEAITVADSQAMESFSRHTIAAAHCIDLRGPAQFQSRVSTSLFLELRRLIVMTAHQLQEPMPSNLEKWCHWISLVQRAENIPIDRFAEINGRLASIRSRIKSEQISSFDDIAALLLPIDKELEDWVESLPPYWVRQTRQSSSAAAPYDYDIYPDIWVASTWNNYRSVRIMIHEHILSATSYCATKEEQSARTNTVRVLRDMATGVCRSVQYYLGEPAENGVEVSCAGMSACYQLIWPLFLSGMLRTTPLCTRSWIAAKLRFIGIRMGLRLAIRMAENLSVPNVSFSDPEAWIIGEWYPGQ